MLDDVSWHTGHALSELSGRAALRDPAVLTMIKSLDCVLGGLVNKVEVD